MPSNIKYEVTGLREMTESFERAAKPMTHRELGSLEARFQAAFRAVRGKTHVDTGYLRFSGRADTHYDGDVWDGEMQFAANPGIFELARGDQPTRSHPEGGHFFFNAVEPFIPQIEGAIDGIIRSWFEGTPI